MDFEKVKKFMSKINPYDDWMNVNENDFNLRMLANEIYRAIDEEDIEETGEVKEVLHYINEKIWKLEKQKG